MTWNDVWKIALGVLMSAIVGLLSYIAVTLKEVPVRFSENEKWHTEERRLREGRDESLQRQISKLKDEFEEYRVEEAERH